MDAVLWMHPVDVYFVYVCGIHLWLDYMQIQSNGHDGYIYIKKLQIDNLLIIHMLGFQWNMVWVWPLDNVTQFCNG